jgi:NAD(P)H-dependent FMN reductase
MATLVGIAGSLRRGSYNLALLRAAEELVPDGVELHVATLHGIPLYDGDLEQASGIPDAVQQLKDRIAAADGLLLASPEYNNSIPGVLKNAIDWLSRPPKDIRRVFGAKPVAVMGATPGQGGTRLSQTAWLPVLRTLGTRPWFDVLLHVGGAADVFGDDGKLVDEATRERLARFIAGFASFTSEG